MPSIFLRKRQKHIPCYICGKKFPDALHYRSHMIKEHHVTFLPIRVEELVKLQTILMNCDNDLIDEKLINAIGIGKMLFSMDEQI